MNTHYTFAEKAKAIVATATFSYPPPAEIESECEHLPALATSLDSRLRGSGGTVSASTSRLERVVSVVWDADLFEKGSRAVFEEGFGLVFIQARTTGYFHGVRR